MSLASWVGSRSYGLFRYFGPVVLAEFLDKSGKKLAPGPTGEAPNHGLNSFPENDPFLHVFVYAPKKLLTLNGYMKIKNTIWTGSTTKFLETNAKKKNVSEVWRERGVVG